MNKIVYGKEHSLNGMNLFIAHTMFGLRVLVNLTKIVSSEHTMHGEWERNCLGASYI